MNTEYINHFGQRVVNVEYGGYKIYDYEHKDKVLLRVGGTAPNGNYVYKDIDAFENGDDVCYIPEETLLIYEHKVKMVQSDKNMTEDEQLSEFFRLAEEGYRKSDLLDLYLTEERTRLFFDAFDAV